MMLQIMAWEVHRMGNWRKQRGLTVTDNVDGNKPLLDGPPTTVELHTSQPGQRSQMVSAF